MKKIDEITTPTLALSCKDDLLVPWHCSVQLAQALPFGEYQQMEYGGHAMSVTDSETFNPLLLTWLLRFASKTNQTVSQTTEQLS